MNTVGGFKGGLRRVGVSGEVGGGNVLWGRAKEMRWLWRLCWRWSACVSPFHKIRI